MSNENNLPAVAAPVFLPAMVASKEAMAQVFAEEMEGMEFRFERVKIPSGGMTAFQVPGDDPANPDILKELVGVIMDDHACNAFWHESYDGSNNPPDCASLDGVTGTVREPGEGEPKIISCKTCPYNEFGSETKKDGTPGKGKACKNMRRVYLLPEGNVFPFLLTVPPTGLRNFTDFKAQRVVGKGRRSFQVLTRVTLIQDKSGDGIVYSKPIFAVAKVLDDENAALLGAYSAQMKQFTREIGITAEDYGNTEEGNSTPGGESVI